MSLTRPVELLEEAVRLLGQLVAALDTQPLRGVGPEDLLTEEEVARYIHMRRIYARPRPSRRCPTVTHLFSSLPRFSLAPFGAAMYIPIMRGGDEAAPEESKMNIRTAKSSLVASTFAALAAHQDEMQGAFPAIEIGDVTVDVDACETADDMASAVRAELGDAIEQLRAEAAQVGDAATVTDCDAAGSDIAALERVCAVLCDAAAQV